MLRFGDYVSKDGKKWLVLSTNEDVGKAAVLSCGVIKMLNIDECLNLHFSGIYPRYMQRVLEVKYGKDWWENTALLDEDTGVPAT